jgi:hypothetical protein
MYTSFWITLYVYANINVVLYIWSVKCVVTTYNHIYYQCGIIKIYTAVSYHINPKMYDVKGE